MIIEKIIKETQEIAYLDNIKCDCCKKNIWGDSKKDKEIVERWAAVKALSSDMDQEDAGDVESFELCGDCYDEVVEFIKSKGGKVPSLYVQEEEDIE